MRSIGTAVPGLLPASALPGDAERYDVVVADFGIAGGCAALEAARAGARVLLLERAAVHGGTSSMSGGHFYLGGGTAVQRATGWEDSADEMYAYLVAVSKEPEHDKIRAYCDGSVEHFDWLEALGFEFERSYYPEKAVIQPGTKGLMFTGNEKLWPYRQQAVPAPRGHKVPVPGDTEGTRMVMDLLRARVEEAGVEVRYETGATQLVAAEDGAVVGLAWRSFDRTGVVAAAAVVIAAGGFVMNPDMVAAYTPALAEKPFTLGSTYDDGLGIRLGASAGAEALRPDGSAIPGLYAAGACASNLAQDGKGYCSGTQLGEGSFFGRRAGRHAARVGIPHSPPRVHTMTDRFEVASRANVPPFHVMDLLAAATTRQRTHGDVLNLLAGQPMTGAPAPVREEAKRLLDGTDPLGYTPAAGILELREAIAGHHKRAHGIDVHPDEVVVTTGSSGGFLLAFLAAFEVDDRVAMARPGYPCYRNVLAALGCEVVEIPTGPETRFQPTVEQVAALQRSGSGIKGLVVASPANPTGTMMLPGELAALAAYCEAEKIQLISDEIYHGIEYAPLLDGGTHLARSAWETSREAVVFSSFSKYFSMTGWRIGWMLVPDRLRRATDVLTGNFTICPPVLAQWASVAAFSDASYEELDGHVRRYAANRALLLDGLPRLGITELAPADGAFYVYADVGHLTDDTMAFCHETLARTGVAMAPGIDFDTVDGGRFVRMSFAGPGAVIEEALTRLSTALDR